MNRSMRYLSILLLLVLGLSGCMLSSAEQQVRETAEAFWVAVQADDMEAAKKLVTWESAQYLQFLQSKQVSTQRFELGELKIQGEIAEIATLLYGGDKGDLKIPVRTVLVKHEDGWLVDVQKTMGSMVSGAMGAVVDQLNSFMQEGLKGLDKSLSESVDQLGETLRNGIKGLEKDLTKPVAPPEPHAPEQKPI